VDAVVLGRETAAAVSLVLDDDVTHAREITLEAWERRSFTERKNEFMARFMAWLL
jgi:broad specificity phosphatase PhoE